MGKCICSHLDEVVIRVLLRLRSLMYLVVATLTALQLFLALFQIVQPAVCYGLNCTSPCKKAMAPHSSTLAWKILWMAEPGRLQSMGSLRVGHD